MGVRYPYQFLLWFLTSTKHIRPLNPTIALFRTIKELESSNLHHNQVKTNEDMKSALLFALLISVELTYGARTIFLEIEPLHEEVIYNNHNGNSLEEIDYHSPLREGDRNDFFMNKLLAQQQEQDDEEHHETEEDFIMNMLLGEQQDQNDEEHHETEEDYEINEADSENMYQSLPDPVMQKPFNAGRPPFYYEPQPRFYYNYQPRSYYPSMRYNYYQPRNYRSYSNSYYSPYLWNYGMQPFHPFYYPY